MLNILFAFGYVISISAYAKYLPCIFCLLFQLGMLSWAFVVGFLFKNWSLAVKLVFLTMLVSLSGSVDQLGVRDATEDFVTSVFGLSLTTLLILPGALMALRLKESAPVVFLAFTSALLSLSSIIQGKEIIEVSKSVVFLLLILFNIQLCRKVDFPLHEKYEFADQILITILMVVIISLASFLFLDVGYYYGEKKYAYLPFSVSIVYFLTWIKVFDRRLIGLVLAIVLSAQYMGVLQSSTRGALLLVIAASGLIWMGKRKAVVRACLVLLPLTLIFSTGDSAGNFLYKYTFLFRIDYLTLLSDPALLQLSIGNAIAELATASYEIAMNLFFPLGLGIALPDSLGIMKFSNEGAFHFYSDNAVAPLHSGFAYLLVWFGVFALVLLKIKKLRWLLIGFTIFTLSYKHLLFMLIVLNLLSKESSNNAIR